MKNPVVLYLFTTFLLIFCTYLLIQQNLLKKTVAEQKIIPHPATQSYNTEEFEIEVAHYMSRIQNYHTKLYFSGINNNTELIKFYLHELEEEMESIADGKVKKDGIDISQAIKTIGLSQIHAFEDQMKEENFDFNISFNQLTLSCNSCHQATEHSYINIIIPETNPFVNQSFKSIK